jgi:nucleotide-binding universal stress UspA family protein
MAPPHTPASPRFISPASTQILRQDIGPVLVAVDGRPSGWHALEWAAAESAARRCSLRIVHCLDSDPVSWDVFGSFSANQWNADKKDFGALVLREAADRAHAVSCALSITTQLLVGPPAAALLQAPSDNTLIVLGRGHASDRGRSSSTSVSRQVARWARCPVAVIELFNEPMRGPSAGRVVVGFDRTGVPGVALGYAFRAAQRRGVGLTTLQTWTHGSARRDEILREALGACRDAFPDVDVRQRFTTGPVGPALAAESPGAALVVLASRGYGRLPLDSVKSVAALLRTVRSPVAIVGTDRRRGKRRTAGESRSIISV